MKRFLPRLKNIKGFTLIELLVVIGILGILAAALVATIDPFEQLNKAKDANTKNILVEYLNGVVRFYTTHQAYPWDPTIPNPCNGGNPPDGSASLCTGGSPCTVDSCVLSLISESELKPSFSEATGNLTEIYTNLATDNQGRQQFIGCFKPTSKSGQKDPLTKFNADGTDGTNCISAGGQVQQACYWCTK